MTQTFPRILLCFWLFGSHIMAQGGQTVAIDYKHTDAKQAFGAQDLATALEETGNTIVNADADLNIVFTELRQGMGPESFRIRKEGDRRIRIVYGDSVGAMYGAIELAEQISLGGGLNAIEEKARKPYIAKRGLKFNIPLDARFPSYDDTGDSAHYNVPVMWEWNFWKEFFDNMIRNRYNVLTLWTNHPYPSIVKLDKYPAINSDAVHVLSPPFTVGGGPADRHGEVIDFWDPKSTRPIIKITLEDKIAFWTKVFDYAENHGIDIHVFHWNLYTFGATGKHGITADDTNPATKDYIRYCITRFLETYPQIDGIGVAPGEHFKTLKPGSPRAEYIWDSYGQGIMDHHKTNPKREITFIFRKLGASVGSILDAFQDYTAGPLHTDHKYARAHMHSTTTSPYLDIEYRKSLDESQVPCWLNVRNDDVYLLRWGDPDYIREFWANIPRDVLRSEAGFFMGPDGYVQGREFYYKNKDSNLSGQLEVDKHWYRFMMIGRLAYDLTLTRDYFEARLKQRFPETNASLLYDTFKASSKIIPLVNQFYFRKNDNQFAPEGDISRSGYLTLDRSLLRFPTMRHSGILSAPQYADAIVSNKSLNGITPVDVANNLDQFATTTLHGVEDLRKGTANQEELLSTLLDLESMAYLGKYYADKIRAASQLAIYQKDGSKKQSHKKAVEHMTDAATDWEAYAKAATSQYHPQLFSRTDHMDWWKIHEEIKKEVERIRGK